MVRNINLGSNSRYAGSPPEGHKEFHDSFKKLSDIGYIVSECKVTDISVRGKFMYWTFSNIWYMFSTFGMSGQWSPTAGKHVCLEVQLIDDDGKLSQVHFNDPRHFGTVKFINDAKGLAAKLDELGWDPLSMDMTNNLKWVQLQCAKTSKSIAEVLMDQTVFSGVGNYIRAEALYLSKFSPWRPANKLTSSEIELLCKSIVSVMESSYQHQGATIQTYKTAYGEEGRYSTLFKVYGKKQDPMGRKIVKQQTPDKRSIHWCPEVQV